MNKETLVISLLNTLVRTPSSELDAGIDRVLARLGEICAADRAFVFAFRADDTIDNTYEWVAEGIEAMRQILQNVPRDTIGSWDAVLRADQIVHIPSVAELPNDAPEKETLQMQGIQSVVVVPILADGTLVGFAGLDRVRHQGAFADDQINFLRNVADVIQATLMRKEALQDLERTRDKLELTLAAIPDLLVEVDLDGVYMAYHHDSKPSWAFAAEDTIGRKLEDILRPEIAADRRRMMARVKAGEVVTGVEQLLDANDPSTWVEVSVSLRAATGPDDPGGYLFLIRNIADRKAREAELAAANVSLNLALAERDSAASRLNELSTISNDWVWEQDAATRYTYISPNVKRFGVTPDFFLGQTRLDMALKNGIAADDPGFVAITAKMDAKEPFRDILYKATHPEGHPVFMRFSGTPRYDEKGQFCGYRGIGSDVTDISLREQTARETANRFAAIMAALPDMLFEVDTEGRFSGFTAGPAYLRLHADGAIEGKLLEDVLPPDVAAIGRKALQQVIETGHVNGLRYSLEVNDETRIFSISGAKMESPLPEGCPSAIFLVRDVTEETQQRDELMKLGMIVEAMTNLVVVVDTEQRIVWFNRAYSEKSGWNLDEVRGALFENLVRCDERDTATSAALQDALRAHKAFRGETVNKDRFGNRYWIDFNVQPLFGSDGALQGFVTVETDITEHKRQRAEMNRLADEALAMRTRLENALDALPDSVVVFDSDDRLLIANKEYRRMFPVLEPVLTEGQHLETILRRGLEANVLPSSAPDADIETSLADKMARYSLPHFNDEVQLPDGRWVRRINMRTSDMGCITVAIDITARRNHIAALDQANMELTHALNKRAEAETQLTKVMEGAAIGTWEWNAVTQKLTIGGQWREILGYDDKPMPPLDLSGFRKLVHPDDQNVFDSIGDVRENKPTALTETEFRMQHRSGHWVWVLSRSQITRFSSDGRPEIIGGVHLNISERKALEQGLESGKKFLEQVMDASIAAIIVMDADGTIIYANTEAERILRLKRDEMTGIAFNAPRWRATQLDGSTLPDEDLPFARAVREQAPVRDLRFAITWDDGTRRSLSVNALAFKSEGEGLQVVTSFNDITEELAATTRLEQARQQAEEASKSKSMFLANMSHEIRTPLNGVLGMAEVLEGTLTEDRQRRMIGTIRSSGETLLSILNDILDMSKIEAGKMEIEQILFVVDDLVQSVQALNAVRAEEKGLDLRVHTNSGCALPLLGDPHRISQILNNLLHNAIKFTESGSVMLTMHYQPGEPLEMVVQDSGIGMTDAQIARMLDSFEQADGSITRRFGGTGLGMSIVRQLVSLMRGEIKVDSAPGSGTTIRVTLPLVAADPADLPQPGALAFETSDSDISHLQVLVADDSATNRMVIAEMLRDTGISIIMAENGREALDLWQAHLVGNDSSVRPFDIVLMDISMPVMDGVSALTEIRSIEAAQKRNMVPVIAVTANAMPHQIADYLIAGFDTHLSKPFKRNELIHAIATLTA